MKTVLPFHPLLIALLFMGVPSGLRAQSSCATAATLTAGIACSTTEGDLQGATSAAPVGTCGGATATTTYGVWYKFTAVSIAQTIIVSNLGSYLSPTTTYIEVFNGTCGRLTRVAPCQSVTSGLNATGLTVGAEYYIRVYVTSSTTTNRSTNRRKFDICVQGTPKADIANSKSYINLSKGNNGGTVNVGDTLEMRAVFVVNTSRADSVAFYDTLYRAQGLRLIPGSIALRTNEGLVYKSYTDGFDSDAGWYQASGLDTVIRINFGVGASNFKRGQVSNTTKPVFQSTSIVLATYRVVVYAPYNTRINFRTGAFTYKDGTMASVHKIGFGFSNLMVYQSPGLCPNAVSPSNAINAESNGTFGAPASGAPLVRNRTPSAFTNYIYNIFAYDAATSSYIGPNDYYYGITNNTSARYTTVNTWNKPDNNNYRVFTAWDIIGDHTGAADPAKGNQPCDTTKPVSGTNPCGYMMIVNSAYKMDTAFQYTASNLCPNTYYEISAWFRNICYNGGADSNGVDAHDPGYIPTGPGDSSGVKPNIAFDVNGTDYYTTGNIQHFGLSPTASDSTNKWVKRGFTYLTGPTETSMTLTLRNNAPGGSGNDWALDDISIANCLPDMKYSPTLTPTVCQDNIITLHDTVRSYFNNYNYYQWQRSTDGGATWRDIPGQSGAAVPMQVAPTQYQYVTSYTVLPASTQGANNGDQYRVMVATTARNLQNKNCQSSDATNVINLSVLTNCTVLPTRILSFNGKLAGEHAVLYWTTSHEEEPVQYSIERSSNGSRFTRIGTIRSSGNKEQNRYAYTDSGLLTGKAWYRIALIDQQNRTLYSRNIVLSSTTKEFSVTNMRNPFRHELLFDVAVSKDTRITASLYTLTGTLVKKQNHQVYAGVNSFTMTNLEAVPQGMYLLQIQCGEKTITQKVVKQ